MSQVILIINFQKIIKNHLFSLNILEQNMNVFLIISIFIVQKKKRKEKMRKMMFKKLYSKKIKHIN